MRTLLPSAALAFVIAALLSGPAGLAQGTAGLAASPVEAARSSPDGALIKTYCAGCHNDRTKSGELSLEHADLANIPLHADLWEKVIRKVRAGMMPPPGMPRPDAATLDAFVESSRNDASIEPRRRTHVPAARRFTGSIAPNTPTRFATCWRSKSMPPRCCRPTMRAAGSTTSRTCSACRRR